MRRVNDGEENRRKEEEGEMQEGKERRKERRKGRGEELVRLTEVKEDEDRNQAQTQQR